MAPEIHGKAGVTATQDGFEMVLESLDGTFSGIATMHVGGGELWKAALLDTFTMPNSTTNQLKDPLAEWLIDPTPYWKWRYVNVNGLITIYEKRALHACRYTATRPTRQPCLRKLPQNVTLPEVPSTSMLISIRSINDDMIQQLGNPHTDQFFQNDIDNLPKSWHNRITDKADNWMIQEVRTPECRQLLAKSIRQGNAIGVSDGSYCPNAQKRLLSRGNSMPNHRPEAASSQPSARPPTKSILPPQRTRRDPSHHEIATNVARGTRPYQRFLHLWS